MTTNLKIKDSDAAAATKVAKGRARNQNSAKDDGTNFLSVYFREMSSLEVLKPEQEFECASEIEALEINIWVRLLALPSATDYILKKVEKELEETPSFRAVRRAATVAKKSRSKENIKKIERAVRKIGVELRDCDKDRIVLEKSVAMMRSIHANPDAHKLPFNAKGKGFDSYMRQLIAADRAAHHARNDFVKANLRLVVSIARRFNHGRMSLADLIQEGNLGLIKAVERYDYRKGFRFSTYASWWIRHAISRALADKGREVRLPVHMIDAQHRLTKARRELTGKLQRPPTSEELAEATNLAVAKIEKMRSYLLDSSLPLDRPVNDEDGRQLSEVLEDPNRPDVDLIDRLTNETQTLRLRSVLKSLKPIEADILRQRFGLDDAEEQTLKEIGRKYNLSRERIRQLQEQALGKMRRAMAQVG